MTIMEKFLDKILSARFLITIMIGATYCNIVIHTVHEYIASQKGSAENMESFASGMFMGFSGLAVFVAKAYFDRNDRQPEGKTEVKTEIKQQTNTGGTNDQDSIKPAA